MNIANRFAPAHRSQSLMVDATEFGTPRPRTSRWFGWTPIPAALLLSVLAADASAGTTFDQDNTANKLTLKASNGKFTSDGTYSVNLAPFWTGTVTVSEANKAIGNDAVTISWSVAHTGSGCSWADTMYASTKGQSKGTHELVSKTKQCAHSLTETDSFKATLSYTVGGVGGWNMTNYTFVLTAEHISDPGCSTPLSIFEGVTPHLVRFTATGTSVKEDCDEIYQIDPEWLGHVAIHRLETSSGTPHDQVNLSWSVFHKLSGSIYTDALVGNAQTSSIGANTKKKQVTLWHEPDDDGADKYRASLAYTIEPNGTEISNFSFSLQGDHSHDGQFFKMAGEAGGMLGTGMMASADLDHDGSLDLLVGSPFGAAALGSVVAHSTAKGLTLWSRDGMVPGALYGSVIATVGDVNGDGTADVAVGAPDPAGIGMVEILSGASGSPIFQIVGSTNGDGFGSAIAGLGDVNQDGVSDLAVGSPLESGSGRVRIFSGNNGVLLASYGNGLGGSRYGASIAAMGDLNFDGWVDLAVGAPGAGIVYTISGNTGVPIFTLPALGEFGAALAALGDVDGDSIQDLVIGAPGHLNAIGEAVGAVIAISGFNQAVLLLVEGNVPGARLGAAVAAAGDIDGDGVGDIVAGAPEIGNGSAFVFSGAGPSPYTPVILRTFTGEANGDRFGSSVAGIADLDSDGLAEVVIGAPAADANGMESGSAVILRAQNGALHPGTGDGALLRTGVNGAADTDSLKYATQLDTLFVELDATAMAVPGMPALMLIQLVDTDVTPISLPAYSNIYLGLGTMFILQFPLSGAGTMNFQLSLPAAPQSPIVAGTSLLFQGVVANPMSLGFFSTTDMHEVRIF